MTTARQSKVFSALVTLPGGTLPDEDFILKLADSGLPNSDVLTQAGMDIEVVCKTLAWIQSLPVLKMPESISSKRMTQLADVLHTIVTQSQSKRSPVPLLHRLDSISVPKAKDSMQSQGTSTSSQEVYFVYDTENMDACAACHVLQKMLIPLSDYATELVPYIPESVRLMPTETATAIVMCTNGVIENSISVTMFAHVHAYRHSSYPVLAEPTFRFPPPDVHSWLRQSISGKVQEEELQDASSCIQSLFKEIAVQFQPNTASLSVLQVNAREVLRRVISLKKRGPQVSSVAVAGHSCGTPTAAGRQPTSPQKKTVTLNDEVEALVGKRSTLTTDAESEPEETVSRI